MYNILPEERRKKLRDMLCHGKHVRVMEASSGLSGLIVENVKAGDKEYDAMWISSLCNAAWQGKPDNEVVDFSDRLRTIENILEVTTKPVIVDGDTGGKTEHFLYHVRTLERLGVSAIIIEDKKGLKQNSLLGNSSLHMLEDKEVFADKIRMGKAALQTSDFMIIARIESFIAGNTMEDALDRAECYVDAGADAIMIHSCKSDGKEIMQFLHAFRKKHAQIPVVLIPTTYCTYKEDELFENGADVVIYANHLLRCAYKSMVRTAEQILECGRAMEADIENCISIKEILELISDEQN